MNDFDNMTIEQLRELRRNIDRAISNYAARTRQAALNAAEEAARNHGFRLADLIEAKTRRKNVAGRAASSDVRYINPDNPSETWSGRGRRPGWIKAALSAGGTLDDLSS